MQRLQFAAQQPQCWIEPLHATDNIDRKYVPRVVQPYVRRFMRDDYPPVFFGIFRREYDMAHPTERLRVAVHDCQRNSVIGSCRGTGGDDSAYRHNRKYQSCRRRRHSEQEYDASRRLEVETFLLDNFGCGNFGNFNRHVGRGDRQFAFDGYAAQRQHSRNGDYR